MVVKGIIYLEYKEKLQRIGYVREDRIYFDPDKICFNEKSGLGFKLCLKDE